MGGKYKLIFVLIILIIIAGCSSSDPGVLEQFNYQGQVLDVVLTPAPGQFSDASVSISMSTATPSSAIFYAIDGSLPVDLNSWVTAAVNAQSNIEGNAACFTVFDALNGSIYNQTVGNNTYSWQFQIGGLIAVGVITQNQVMNCQEFIVSLNETDFTSFLSTIDVQAVNDCNTILLAMDDMIVEDLNSWIQQANNLGPNVVGECSAALDEWNSLLQTDIPQFLYQGPVTIYDDSTLAVIAMKDYYAPSNLVIANYDLNVGSTNTLPDVALTSPSNGATFTAGDDVVMLATASDPDQGGSISKVEFVVNNNVVGEATTSPYSYTWSNVAVGTYSLQAKATDNEGGIKFSTARSITVNPKPLIQPTLSITAPANGATVLRGTNVQISTSVVDPDGLVQRVEFFVDKVKIGEDTSNPYSYNWTNVQEGTHNVTARIAKIGGGYVQREITVYVNNPHLTLDAKPSWIINVGQFSNVTCSASETGTSLTLRRNGATVKQGTNRIFEYVNLSAANYTYNCTSSTLSVSNRLIVLPQNAEHVILWDYDNFNNFTNFSHYNSNELKNLSNVSFSNGFGLVRYLVNLDIDRNLDGRGMFRIDNGSIYVNSTHLSEFNKRAKLEFYGINIANPIILRDGVICPANICAGINYDTQTKIFEVIVEGFSNYTISAPFCGDNTCNNGETCSSCSADCGTCAPPSSSGSSGGGGGGGYSCIPEWDCGAFKLCEPAGIQRRTCVDINDCGKTINMPSLTRSCTYVSFNSNAGEEEQQEPAIEQGGQLNDGELVDVSTTNKSGSIIYFIIIGIVIVGTILFFIIKSQGPKQKSVAVTMENPKIPEESLQQGLDYIKRMQQFGLNDEEISGKMKSAGWTDEQINYLFYKLK